MSELMLDVGQANELKLAFRRAGYTNDEIKRLCEGTTLADVRNVLRGLAEVKTIANVRWTVTSDGRTAEELIRAIEAKGMTVGDWAKDIMTRAFRATSGVTYPLVVIRGEEFAESDRTTADIFAEAKRRGYRLPPTEVAPLLRLKYTQDELGFPYVAVFHEPVRDSGGGAEVLRLYRDDAQDWLNGWRANHENRWHRESVFVFLAPQV